MKKTIAALTVLTFVFVLFYFFLCYAWIGAEYRIDGVVHFGKVDATVAFALSCIAIDYIFGVSKRKKTSEGKYANT